MGIVTQASLVQEVPAHLTRVHCFLSSLLTLDSAPLGIIVLLPIPCLFPAVKAATRISQVRTILPASHVLLDTTVMRKECQMGTRLSVSLDFFAQEDNIILSHGHALKVISVQRALIERYLVLEGLMKPEREVDSVSLVLKATTAHILALLLILVRLHQSLVHEPITAKKELQYLFRVLMVLTATPKI